MRVPRIYQERDLQIHDRFILTEDAARHLVTVLRLDLNDKLTLFNGDGQEYQAIITHIKKQAVEITIQAVLSKNVESPLKIHLGQAISKGERMDLTLQKATELGVTEITPLFSTRSEVHLKGERESKKMRHWQKVIISACEQCGRNRLPTLYSPISIHEWINQDLDKNAIKIMLDHRSQTTLTDLQLQSSVFLLAGPEGGLTFEEKMAAGAHQFQGIRLGPRILRTETAAMVAMSGLQLLAGDLANLENNKPSP